MTRAMKRIAAFWMVAVLLFAQLSVSAYACPGTPAPKPVNATAVAANLVDCDAMQGKMDPQAPALCDACCHHDQQSNHASSLDVSPAILASLYEVPMRLAPTASTRLAAMVARDPASAAPPRTILHCCWRI
jgi:hypothetical protein